MKLITEATCVSAALVWMVYQQLCQFCRPRYDVIIVDPSHPKANWHGPVFKTLRQASRFYDETTVLILERGSK